jgi:SAM-dependent methyltransferase
MADTGSANRWLTAAVPRGAGYDARFEALAAGGAYVHGEADLVASWGPRTVLDAGCGTGRVAVELARRGVDVVGVDVDPAMLTAARAKAPGLTWVEADLAGLDLGRTFDVVVMAGNVMCFVAPGSEGAVVAAAARHVAPEGRLVAGFALDRGIAVERYDELAAAAGLVPEERFSTWEGAPHTGSESYAVSVHRRH